MTTIQLALAAVFSISAGCAIPLSTGSAQPATTVGKHHVGVSLTEQAPAYFVDVDEPKTVGSESAFDSLGLFGAGKAIVAFGLSNDVDVEASVDTADVFYVLPLPVGGSLGVRDHVYGSDNLDIGIAAHAGMDLASERSGCFCTDPGTNSGSVKYADVSITAQGVFGTFRPLLSLSAMPMIINQEADGYENNFNAIATSATVGLMTQTEHTQFGPYVSATYFHSDDKHGDGFAVSGNMVSLGIAFSVRPDRHPGSH